MTKIIKKKYKFYKNLNIIHNILYDEINRIDCKKVRKLKGVYEYYKTLDALKHNID